MSFVPETLVIALAVVMFHELVQDPPEVALPQRDHSVTLRFTATARKLAVLVYRTLKGEVVYCDAGADAYNARPLAFSSGKRVYSSTSRRQKFGTCRPIGGFKDVKSIFLICACA